MQQVSNPFQALTLVLIKPNGVFHTLASKHNWSWIPFIATVASIFIAFNSYFAQVDFNWYIDSQILAASGPMSPAERDLQRQNMTLELVKGTTITTVILASILANAILAAYLNGMTKHDESHVHGFTDWYGFLWWTQVPALLNFVIALALIYFSGTDQLSFSVIAPLSLAYIFSVPVTSEWLNWLSSVRLDTIWMIYLTAVGLNHWTQINMHRIWIIAFAPYVIIYGLWSAAIAFG
jgi:hypothetical protein